MQNRESSPAKDRRSTAVPHNQPTNATFFINSRLSAEQVNRWTTVYLIYAVTPRRLQLVTARRIISVQVTALIVHLIAVVWLGDDSSALGSVFWPCLRLAVRCFYYSASLRWPSEWCHGIVMASQDTAKQSEQPSRHKLDRPVNKGQPIPSQVFLLHLPQKESSWDYWKGVLQSVVFPVCHLTMV